MPVFTVWELADGPATDTSEVTVTFWTETSNPFDKLREAFGGSRFFRRDGSERSSACVDRRGGSPRAASPDRRHRPPARLQPLGATSYASGPHACPLRRPHSDCLLAAIALAAAGCGPDAVESDGNEGEPVEVSGLEYNIQITRFLNPADNEDSEYLVGQPPTPAGSQYLGVFLVVDNQTEDLRPSATNYVVTDTLDNEYELLDSKSPYALEVGADVPAHEQLPLPDTTPYAGFNKGSLLIFEVPDAVSENRPLQLHIDSFDGSGEVTLDI